MQIYNKKRELLIVAIAFAVMLLSVTTVSVLIAKKQNRNSDIVITDLEEVYNGPVVHGVSIMSEEEFESIKDVTAFSTYSNYLALVNSEFESSTVLTADKVNMDIYNYCDTYFNCYYGYDRISPIFPMALSNVETPERADNNITWCALFPSKYVNIDELDTFCVTDVIRDEAIYKALSTEYSTRDRGCLQMSPTYGTSNPVLNSRMSGNEKDKLSGINSSYTTWISGASSSSGDRFYLPDVLLRLQCAMQDNISCITRNGYTPNTDMSLIAMLSVGHNSGSGVWACTDHSKRVGNWKSCGHAYNYCLNLGSREFIEVIQNYADYCDRPYINTREALQLYSKVFDDDISDYTTSTTNGVFPIKTLYAYIKLSSMYTQ